MYSQYLSLFLYVCFRMMNAPRSPSQIHAIINHSQTTQIYHLLNVSIEIYVQMLSVQEVELLLQFFSVALLIQNLSVRPYTGWILQTLECQICLIEFNFSLGFLLQIQVTLVILSYGIHVNFLYFYQINKSRYSYL